MLNYYRAFNRSVELALWRSVPVVGWASLVIVCNTTTSARLLGVLTTCSSMIAPLVWLVHRSEWRYSVGCGGMQSYRLESCACSLLGQWHTYDAWGRAHRFGVPDFSRPSLRGASPSGLRLSWYMVNDTSPQAISCKGLLDWAWSIDPVLIKHSFTTFAIICQPCSLSPSVQRFYYFFSLYSLPNKKRQRCWFTVNSSLELPLV